MKRKIVLLLAIACLLVMSGCGKQDESAKDVPAQEVTDTAEDSGTNTEETETANTNTDTDDALDTETDNKTEQESGGEEANIDNIADINLNDELSEIEKQSEILDEEIKTSSDYLKIADESYQLWDNELNVIWDRLKEVLSDEEMAELVSEELDWIDEKEEKAAEEAAEYEGGSLYSMILLVNKAKITRERVYELASYLGEIVGQTVNVPEKEDYSGMYVDTYGTDDVYSELELEKLADGTYKASISIYRLVSLEGTAEDKDGYLTFEDTDYKVKGDIMLQDSGAVFRVTSSEFEYMNVGDVFEFPEKK